MSTYEGMRVISVTGGSDLTGNQNLCVIMSSDGLVDQAGANAENFIGVQVSKPAVTTVGTAVTVATEGVVKVVSGDTITAGNNLACDALGAVDVAATGEPRIGIAMESAVAADVFRMLIARQGDAP